MKVYFKYGVLLIITLAIAYVCLTLRNCGEGGQISAVVIPAPDSGHVPILKTTYKPASTPFEGHSKSNVKPPANVPESQISRVIIIHPKELPSNDSSAHRLIGSMTIIETKDGRIYIDTTNVKSVEMIAYEEPILRFGSFISLGVSMSLQHVTLAGAIAPLQICGVVQFPFIALDTEGIGGGLAARTREISIGLLFHQPFTGDRQLKISFTYNL